MKNLANSAFVNRLKETAPVRIIVGSFFLIIVLGTLLLTLPISSRDGTFTNLLDAAFTSTSATCVTGLVVMDTWTHWNLFGQIVILFLIQVGGLGVVTFTTGFTLLLRRRLGLRDLRLAQENTNGNAMGMAHLIRMILVFTFTCEAVGAIVFCFRFIPLYGAGQGIWISIFLAVSAYCNAGFDILGFIQPYGNLIPFANDPLVCITVSFLIILGGLGFVVISDVYFSKLYPTLRRKKRIHLNFHSIVVLTMSGFLLVAGTILYMICEYNNVMAGAGFFEKLNISFLQATSMRTAGFASVNLGAEEDITKIISVVLMFIGASPGSTGGGIKTTTFVVLAATVISAMRGYDETILHKRKIDKSVVYRALAIFTIALLIVLITTGIILVSNPNHSVSAVDALFEATSAFGTVGLSAVGTQNLSEISQMALILTMFIGRVGPLSLGLALTMRRGRNAGASVLPEGKIIVG